MHKKTLLSFWKVRWESSYWTSELNATWFPNAK